MPGVDAGKSVLEGAWAVDHVDERRVEPGAHDACRGNNPLAPGVAFPDDGSCQSVAGLEIGCELLAVHVEDLCALGAQGFGNQKMFGPGSACGVELDGLNVEELCACAVAHDNAVCRGAVVVGGGEAQRMQAAHAAGCHDDGLCAHNQKLVVVQILQDSACALAVFVLDELDSRAEFENRDALVAHLVGHDAHDFKASEILDGMGALSGVAAGPVVEEGAVCLAVEVDAKGREPVNDEGSFRDQHFHQFLHVGATATDDGVHIVYGRGILGVCGSTYATLGHDGIGIAHAQLGGKEDARACSACREGSGKARTATAYDQNVGIVVYLVEIDVRRSDSARCLYLALHFLRGQIADIGSHLERNLDLRIEVRMKILQQLCFFIECQFMIGLIETFLPCTCTFLNGRHH